MAKEQYLATPASPAQLPDSREAENNYWRTGLKAAASIFRGAIRDTGLGPIPKRATAYYFGISDVGDAASNNEHSAHLQEIEASLLKALASERSSDACARLLVLLEEVRTKIKNIRA